MTKQVFDQIAEGLREAAETPPAWAIEKAREAAIALSLADGTPYGSQIRMGLRDGAHGVLVIARAIAVERERCAKIADALPLATAA